MIDVIDLPLGKCYSEILEKVRNLVKETSTLNISEDITISFYYMCNGNGRLSIHYNIKNVKGLEQIVIYYFMDVENILVKHSPTIQLKFNKHYIRPYTKFHSKHIYLFMNELVKHLKLYENN
jgi:hypothetical protein